LFNPKTYKNKNRLLLIGSVLFLYIAWTSAFGKTFKLKNECIKLEEQMKLAVDIPEKSAQLKKEIARMEQLTGLSKKIENPQQALLDIASSYCNKNNTVLREFPKTINSKQNNLEVETNVFVVEGPFIKLLNLAYLLEQKNKIGKVASVNYISKVDQKTQRTILTATIYLQNIKSNNM
jgi:hypothetical protein